MNYLLGSVFTPLLLAAALPAAAESGPTTHVTTEYLATLYAPLHAPQPVNTNLLIFHPRDGGTLTGRLNGKLISPTGDWVRVLPDGNMRIDVRLTAELDDGSLAYITYGGVLRKPDEASWSDFLAGKKITTPNWYYVIAPNFETTSKKYAWLNGVQAVGKFISIQTGPDAHVKFDLYIVN